MPVFTRLRDGVLVLTVDGDFTANELRRVAYGAFHEDETPLSVPVLLDMSGAAGVTTKSDEELRATGAIFGAYGDRIAGLCIVAPPSLHEIFGADGDFGRASGVAVHACDSHSAARSWLSKAKSKK